MSEKSPKWLPKMAPDIAKCSLKSPYENHCYTTWKICGKKANVNSMSAENYIEKFANVISDKKPWYWTNLFCWKRGSSLRQDSEKKNSYCLTREYQKLLWIPTKRWLLLGVLMIQAYPNESGQTLESTKIQDAWKGQIFYLCISFQKR